MGVGHPQAPLGGGRRHIEDMVRVQPANRSGDASVKWRRDGTLVTAATAHDLISCHVFPGPGRCHALGMQCELLASSLSLAEFTPVGPLR